jgi:hypothetical protein
MHMTLHDTLAVNFHHLDKSLNGSTGLTLDQNVSAVGQCRATMRDMP